MKEQTLIDMQRKVETLGNIIQNLIADNENLQQLAVGTFETVKLLPGYEEAIKTIMAQVNQPKMEINAGSK